MAPKLPCIEWTNCRLPKCKCDKTRKIPCEFLTLHRSLIPANRRFRRRRPPPLGRTVRYVAAAAAAGVGIGWNKQIFDLSHSSFCECPVPRLRALFYHRPRWMRIRIVGQWVSKNNPPQSNSFTSFSAAPSTAMDEGTILALVMRTIRMKKWFLSLEDLNCQIRDFYLQFQLY